MATVSRLVLNHPALGATGGAALHSQVEALYLKIGDAIASRWYQLEDFDQAETVDLAHSFATGIENIRYDIYVNTAGEWVHLTDSTTPARSAFSVIEKAGDENNTLQITNDTGGNDLLAAVVLMNDPLYLAEGDVKDVDITTAAPEAGQTLVWNASTKKFTPGAAGDASFKLQSVATDGSCTLKGGYIGLANGKELATYDGAGSLSTDFGGDLSFNLGSLEPSPVNDTTYYLYINLQGVASIPTVTTDTGRELYKVQTGQLALLTTAPDDLLVSDYVPLGVVRYGTAQWTTISETYATKKHSWESGLVVKDVDDGFTADMQNFRHYIVDMGSAAADTAFNLPAIRQGMKIRVSVIGQSLTSKYVDVTPDGTDKIWYDEAEYTAIRVGEVSPWIELSADLARGWIVDDPSTFTARTLEGDWVVNGDLTVSGQVDSSNPKLTATIVASQSFSYNTWTNIQYTPNLDTNSGWNGTLHRYQPSVAGYYRIVVQGNFVQSVTADDITASQVRQVIRVNGTGVAYSYVRASNTATSAYYFPDVEHLVYLNGTTDYVDVQLYNSLEGNPAPVSITLLNNTQSALLIYKMP